MSDTKRLQFIWKTLCSISHPFFEKKFNYHHEKNILPGPSIVIANHVTNWDPMLLAMAFPKNHLHFVASEHMFRWGVLSKILQWIAAPIARRKGATASETALICMRKIRSGHSVCIFGEGEVTWDGKTHDVLAGTGTLAKASGASLITFRFEGGCLSVPRWAKKARKGKIDGRIIRIYSPETLKTMSTEELTAAINRDIYTDAFAVQEQSPVAYRGKHLAEHLESALFLCPKCRRINTLHSRGDYLSCSCGLNLRYTEYASFSPAEPFKNFQQWDLWQHEELKKGAFQHDHILFSDENILLTKIESESKKQPGDIIHLSLDQYGLLSLGEMQISLDQISNMAMVQADKLFFTYNNAYYQLKPAKGIVNLRKYLAAWQIFCDGEKKENGLFSR